MQAAVANRALTCVKRLLPWHSPLAAQGVVTAAGTAGTGSVMGLHITLCYSTLAQSKAHQGQLGVFQYHYC